MRKLIRLITIVSLMTFLAPVLANVSDLNKVTLQLTGEGWATTQSARVIVSINATVNKLGLAEINNEILKNLAKINDAQWHIVQFNRTQDQSGLEQVHAQAEARLPENQLADLRNKARAVSKPGARYEISTIEFTPSLAELEKARADIRADIYKQAQAEASRLNKSFPEQHYYVYSIDFVSASHPILGPIPLGMNAMVREAASNSIDITFNTKIIETARVVIASQPTYNKNY